MLEAESSILGALVLKPKAYWDIADLDPGDFERHIHREYFQTIRDMVIAGDAVDIITLSDRIGGDSLSTLGNYANNTPGTSNIKHHAKLIRDASQRRHARQVLSEALNRLQGKDDLGDVVQGVLTTLEKPASSKDKAFSEVLTDAILAADEARKLSTRDLIGADTTLPKLNRLTKGFYGGKLITLGGRPGTFKSAFALQILVRNGLKGVPVGMISYEMLSTEIGQRAIAQIHGINGQLLAAGDARTIAQVREKEDGKSGKAKIWIDDKSQTLPEMMSRIIEWRNRHGIQLVVVDYLQLVHTKGRSKREEIGEITRQLKLLAMRLEMPIMILSQLNRDMERENRKPQLSDLRESGDIEQDSDIVLFTHRDKAKSDLESDEYCLILAKQRGGPARMIIDLYVDGECYTIREKINMRGVA